MQALLQAREPLQASASASAASASDCRYCKRVHPCRNSPDLRRYHPFSGIDDQQRRRREIFFVVATLLAQRVLRSPGYTALLWWLVLLTASFCYMCIFFQLKNPIFRFSILTMCSTDILDEQNSMSRHLSISCPRSEIKLTLYFQYKIQKLYFLHCSIV